MKRFLLILFSIIFCDAHAQTVFLADTAFVTDIGYNGAPASCKTNGLVYNAAGMDRSQSIWAADVFTIPTGATWIFDTVIVYGYQYGSSLSSPFTSGYLQIYNGTPGLGGTVVWGDTVTNVLSSTGFTGIYKVDTFSSDNGLLSTKRPIMYLKLYLPVPPHLSAGTYWLAWSATGTSAANPPSTPFKALPGRVNPSGQMARQFAGGGWSYITDNGNSIGLDMMIIGRPGLSAGPVLNAAAKNMLDQNIPKPFSGTTDISFYLPTAGYTKLSVYNVIGQLMTTLVDGNMDAGQHQVSFRPNKLPGGTYYYKLSTSAGSESRQMVLLK